MNSNFIKNCQCQCHFPPSVICPITHCCHCISQEYPNYYSQKNFSPFSSMSSFYKPEDNSNNLLNSYSTNFRSNNDSIDYFPKKTRNTQNQLGRNFSDVNMHMYKNPNQNINSNIEEENNIIQHEPYLNKSQNYFNYDNNNENNDNNNLTYDYHEKENNREYNTDINKISKPEYNPINQEQERIHDMISILQKENEFLKKQRDDALNKLSSIENIKNIDRVKFDELENENTELRNYLNDALNKNNEKDTYILNLKDDLNNLQKAMHDKDREMNDLIVNMKRLEQDANNELDKLRNKIEDINREKEAMKRNYEKEINDLNNAIRDLNNKLSDEERKVKELLNKIKNMKRFDDKKQNLLESLFNWYNNINKLLNTNTANNKAPPKDILNDIINLTTNEEFKDKLDQIEDKLKQFIDNYKLKFGECFACDIACCTSEVDRLKYFRKYYPGPPKDYLQGRKKCKCP